MRRPTLGAAAIGIAATILLVAGGLTGRFGLYSLYTHCGVRYVDFGGARYYADPPLDDGSGNPPPGWGNPTDPGFIFATDSEHAEFFGFFHAAKFSAHPTSGIPTIEVCS